MFDFIEFVNSSLSDLETFLSLGRVETFQDNSDKEVEENERYNNHETDKVDEGCNRVTTSLDVI